VTCHLQGPSHQPPQKKLAENLNMAPTGRPYNCVSISIDDEGQSWSSTYRPCLCGASLSALPPSDHHALTENANSILFRILHLYFPLISTSLFSFPLLGGTTWLRPNKATVQQEFFKLCSRGTKGSNTVRCLMYSILHFKH